MNGTIVKQENMRSGTPDFLTYAEDVVKKTYLPTLSTRSAVQCCGETDIKEVESHAKLFEISRIVYNRKENNQEKLTTLYTALHETDADLVMILHSDGDKVNLYMGVCNARNANGDAQSLFETFKGNFPGSIGSEAHQYNDLCLTDEKMTNVLDGWISSESANAICSVSMVPTQREKEPTNNEEFVQGIERVLDAMQGKTFTAVILAQNIHTQILEAIKAEYERLYSNLSPYAKTNVTFGESQTQSVNDSVTHSVNESVTDGTSVTLSVGHTTTHTQTDSTSQTKTNSFGLFGIFNHSSGNTVSSSDSVSHSTQKTEAKGTQHNTTKGESDATLHGTGESYGSSLSYQIELQQKTAADLMTRIDRQLERIHSSECFGMFGAAAYFIAPNPATAKTAAGMYKALLSGHGSHIETSHINTWTRQSPDFYAVQSSLRCLQHPSFELGNTITTPATLVSGKELALEMGLPMRSVPGITVMETVPFGRNIQTLDAPTDKSTRAVSLGTIYHMWEAEQTPVKLDPQALTAHTFVTGSTGSGKSTTIYKLLDEVSGKGGDIKFMVVEPAKGEYKNVLSANVNFDLRVYGTNPKLTKMLRVNPFRFPSDKIHIYEHLDRLTEIFNVCWPMYAAMPAVLKAAMENAYRSAGWNLTRSENRHGEIYPCFADVAHEVERYINKSEYSDENKSNYKGSLLTRLESLTNGVNSLIFTADDLGDEELFDENVVVDLSRVGSSETKALIMGILVLKLQEHRMATSDGSNAPLRHITVLEEAHTLLKRTSTEQSSESANLLGKSVEMLANSIAEMRTYGEGFIIADQSPGLLDMSVIRNTNTKIIMRLPDQSDRELVGKAANLNNDQITELAKLPRGVAAVYQSDWINPVLCKVGMPKFTQSKGAPFVERDTSPLPRNENLLFDVMSEFSSRESPDDLSHRRALEETVLRSAMPTDIKVKLADCLKEPPSAARTEQFAAAVFDSFENAKDALEQTKQDLSVENLKLAMMAELRPSIVACSDEQINCLLTLLISEYIERYHAEYPVWREFAERIAGGDVV